MVKMGHNINELLVVIISHTKVYIIIPWEDAGVPYYEQEMLY